MTDLLRPANNDPSKNTNASLLIRLYWLFVGNGILFILASHIAFKNVGIYYDIFYWCNSIAIIIARFIDIRFLNGETASGAPATMSDWKRFSPLFFLAAVVIWAIAHIAKKYLGLIL